MSAIREWFGIYNMMFRHIKDKFGEDELEEFLKQLGDTAYDDVSADFKTNGINQIRERYVSNFIKDGGKATAALAGEKLEIEVDACPDYEYMLNSANPNDKPEQYYCECCKRLNSRILTNAGYALEVSDIDNHGRCRWMVIKERE